MSNVSSSSLERNYHRTGGLKLSENYANSIDITLDRIRAGTLQVCTFSDSQPEAQGLEAERSWLQTVKTNLKAAYPNCFMAIRDTALHGPGVVFISKSVSDFIAWAVAERDALLYMTHDKETVDHLWPKHTKKTASAPSAQNMT